jgi:hypothetical protein
MGLDLKANASIARCLVMLDRIHLFCVRDHQTGLPTDERHGLFLVKGKQTQHRNDFPEPWKMHED